MTNLEILSISPGFSFSSVTESVFAPSADMDLDNGEIDDDERELEAFKRFCFNSVPAKQKAKISLDVNTLKRK